MKKGDPKMNQKKDFLNGLETNLMMIMILIASVLTLGTFLFQFFAPGLVEVTRQLSFYAYGWTVFLGLAPAVKKGAFLKVDILVAKYPEGLRKAINILCQLILFILMAALCYYSFRLTVRAVAGGQQNAAAAIPLAVIYAAPVLGYFLGALEFVRKRLERKGESDR